MTLSLESSKLANLTGYRVSLLTFLVIATYYFHDFWTVEDADQKQTQTIAFMKNLALMGAMLQIIANGTGGWSLDNKVMSSREK